MKNKEVKSMENQEVSMEELEEELKIKEKWSTKAWNKIKKPLGIIGIVASVAGAAYAAGRLQQRSIDNSNFDNSNNLYLPSRNEPDNNVNEENNIPIE